MTWPTTGSLISGSLVTDLAEFYLLGSNANAGLNLVNSTSGTVTLNNSPTFGSDSIGAYFEITNFTDRVRISNSSYSISGTDAQQTFAIVFSRRSTPVSSSTLVDQIVANSPYFLSSIAYNGTGPNTNFTFGTSANSLAYDLATPTADTEFCFVVVRNSSNLKVFYTGGSSALSGTSSATVSTALNYVNLGNNDGAGAPYYARYRAYGRWNRALSDSDAQSIANNPQQLLLAPAFTPTDTASFNRGIGRGIARGIA